MDRAVDESSAPAALERLCVELAGSAAARVRAAGERHDERRAGGGVGTKSADTDLVTEVDRATEQWLREQLAARRPHDAVLGEEAGEQAGDQAGEQDGSDADAVRWLLDPIDGTVNFVLGLPLYAVSVAAEVAGRVVAGAVAAPASGEVFHARLGGGAHLDGHRLHGPRTVALESAVVATGFGYDRARRARQGQIAAALLARVGDVRRLGTAALELCFLAAGRVDGYYETGLHEWDHAAGALIAAEAGCTVTGLRGRPASDVMVAAAGPGLAGPLFALLEELDADR